MRTRSLSRNDVLRHRLAAQRLTGPGFASAVDVVREHGAVQSQDYAGAKWGVGLRVDGASDSGIDAALNDGSILRTHVLRPTWHFVAADDIRWMLALTGPHIQRTLRTYDARLGIDAKLIGKSNDVIAGALEGGKALTRTEIAGVLTKARIKDAKLQRLAHLMMQAELDAVVCSGPRRGKKSTYALVAERAPQAQLRDRDDALGELARRYFTTHGPATVQDFGWWSGLKAVDARRAVELASKHLVTAMYEGSHVWFAKRTLKRAAPHAHMLPNYDEYFIGHKDRSAIGRRVRDLQEVAGDQFFAHLVFVNGELVAGWKRLTGAKGVAVKFTMVATVTSAERKLIDKARARYGRFLGQTVEVRHDE